MLTLRPPETRWVDVLCMSVCLKLCGHLLCGLLEKYFCSLLYCNQRSHCLHHHHPFLCFLHPSYSLFYPLLSSPAFCFSTAFTCNCSITLVRLCQRQSCRFPLYVKTMEAAHPRSAWILGEIHPWWCTCMYSPVWMNICLYGWKLQIISVS